MTIRRLLGILGACGALTFTACAVQTPVPPQAEQQHLGAQRAPLPGALIELATQRVLPFEAFSAALARFQVIALGEEHYHPDIQAFELRLLQALVHQRPQGVILAMEFLERDMQSAVDAYLAGTIDATALYMQIKATPDFMRYYAPLLQYAREARVPVRAINAPRALARRVTHTGLQAVVASLTSPERAYVAATFAPMPSSYRTYCIQAMAAAHPLPPDQLERFVEASYLKDATMAESLATVLVAEPAVVVLAIAGRFHMDYGLALPALLQQRHPGVTVVRVATMALESDDDVDVHRLASEGLAEYVWFAPPRPAGS